MQERKTKIKIRLSDKVETYARRWKAVSNLTVARLPGLGLGRRRGQTLRPGLFISSISDRNHESQIIFSSVKYSGLVSVRVRQF